MVEPTEKESETAEVERSALPLAREVDDDTASFDTGNGSSNSSCTEMNVLQGLCPPFMKTIRRETLTGLKPLPTKRESLIRRHGGPFVVGANT